VVSWRFTCTFKLIFVITVVKIRHTVSTVFLKLTAHAPTKEILCNIFLLFLTKYLVWDISADSAMIYFSAVFCSPFLFRHKGSKVGIASRFSPIIPQFSLLLRMGKGLDRRKIAINMSILALHWLCILVHVKDFKASQPLPPV